MKKLLSLLMLLCMVCTGAWADVVPELTGKIVESVSDKTQTIESGKWYVLSGCRKDGGNYITPTPIYDQGAGSSLKREATDNTVATTLPVGAQATNIAKYLVRFVDGDITGSKKIQFATGNYVAPLTSQNNSTQVKTQTTKDNAADLFVYGATNSETTYGGPGVAINFANSDATFGKRWDGDGQNNVILVWGNGVITSDKNNVWLLQEVTLGYPIFPAAGTYYMTIVNKDTSRDPYLYNSLQYNDDVTIQAASLPSPIANNNGYIWKVESDGSGNVTVKNGATGKGITPSGGKGGQEITSFQYTGASTGYYYLNNSEKMGGDHDRLNCADNTPSYHNEANVRAVTTWNGDHTDNEWKFENVDMTSLFEYTVEITGVESSARAYAEYNGQKALNGGFFLASSIAENELSAADVDGFEKSVSLSNYTITVAYKDVAGLQARIDDVMTAIFADKIGYPDRYNDVNTSAISELWQYQTTSLGSPVDADNYNSALDALNAVYALTNINLPKDGKAYVFTNIATDKSKHYLYENTTSDKLLWADRGTSDVNDIPANGKYVCRVNGSYYTFVNIETGHYLIWRGTNAGYNSAKGYEADYNNEDCRLFIERPVYNSGNMGNATSQQDLFGWVCFGGKRDSYNGIDKCFLYSNGTDHFNQDTGHTQRYGSGHSSMFAIEETTNPNTVKLTNPNPEGAGSLDNMYLGTFSAPYAVELPADVVAYKASVQNSTTVEFVSIGRIVPKNTGVLIYSENAEETITKAAIPAATADMPVMDGNIFSAAVNNQTINVGDYVLGKGSMGVMFYPRVSSTTLTNKAYIPASALTSATVQFVFNNEDCLTGIKGGNIVTTNTTSYDLSGRRVNGTVKGISIVNGKKVIR